MDRSVLSKAYMGRVAEGYEGRRAGSRKWRHEQEGMNALLGKVPENLRVLDVPVGTGRFLELYKRRKQDVIGIDASEDMLAECRRNAAEAGVSVTLKGGDIFELPVGDDEVDMVVCVRFVNWLARRDLGCVLEELVRVSRKYVILGVRLYVPMRELIRSLGSLQQAAKQCVRRAQGWTQSNSLVIHERRTLENQYRRLGARVVNRERIELRGDGTDYSFYLLRVDATEANGR